MFIAVKAIIPCIGRRYFNFVFALADGLGEVEFIAGPDGAAIDAIEGDGGDVVDGAEIEEDMLACFCPFERLAINGGAGIIMHVRIGVRGPIRERAETVCFCGAAKGRVELDSPGASEWGVLFRMEQNTEILHVS